LKPACCGRPAALKKIELVSYADGAFSLCYAKGDSWFGRTGSKQLKPFFGCSDIGGKHAVKTLLDVRRQSRRQPDERGYGAQLSGSSFAESFE
jgi:hypothetical protein